MTQETNDDPAIWHYLMNGQQIGPVTGHDFRSLLASGQLPSQTMVWRDGFPSWLPASQVPDLIGQNSALAPNQALNPQNQASLISMILGIIGVVLSFACFPGVGGIFSIPAVILGHKGKKQIDESTPKQTGEGMALAGLITGYVGIAIAAVMVCILIFFGIALTKTGTTSISPPHVITSPTTPIPGSSPSTFPTTETSESGGIELPLEENP